MNENQQKILQLLQEAPDPKARAEAYKTISDMYKGENGKEQLLEDMIPLHEQELIELKVMLEVVAHIDISETTGMSLFDARELARRYIFMMLEVAERDNLSPEDKQARLSALLGHQGPQLAQEIFEGTCPEEKLAVIKTLPDWQDWDKDKAYEIYKQTLNENTEKT